MRGGNDEMISAGLEALDWLGTIQRCEIKGHFVPIGSHGFYSRKTEKARFDQQPVEACAVVSACLQAYRAFRGKPLEERGVVCLQLVPGRITTCRSRSTITPPADVGTVCIRIEPMKTRVRNRRYLFLMALLEMRKLEEADVTESNSR